MDRQPSSKETVTFKNAGNHPILADVYLPSDAENCPVILWIHGGALIMGHRGNIHRAQLSGYLEAGYALVSIDYRLAPESKLPDILEDVRDGHAWVVNEGAQQFGWNGKRVAVVGHSAGGYLTLMTGFCVEPRPRALVAFYGYGDILGDWYRLPSPFYCQQPAVTRDEALASVGSVPVSEPASPNQRFRLYLYCRQQGRWLQEVMGKDPETERDAFLPYCPVFNVSGDYPPTLLLHGDADTDVPYEQSVQMADALEQASVPVELMTIPGGAHGFDGKTDSPAAREAFDRVLRFLRDR